MSTLKLITNSNDAPLVNGKTLTLCDDTPEGILPDVLREERDIRMEDLKKLFQEYKEQRKKTPAGRGPFIKNLLNAANFPASDIIRIIDQNREDLKFLRVYIGIDAKNNHVLCIGPVDNSNKVIVKNDTIFSTQCCGNPPNTDNFKNDPILGT